MVENDKIERIVGNKNEELLSIEVRVSNEAPQPIPLEEKPKADVTELDDSRKAKSKKNKINLEDAIYFPVEKCITAHSAFYSLN